MTARSHAATFDTVVVGGGPAGLMAAETAARAGASRLAHAMRLMWRLVMMMGIGMGMGSGMGIGMDRIANGTNRAAVGDWHSTSDAPWAHAPSWHRGKRMVHP